MIPRVNTARLFEHAFQFSSVGMALVSLDGELLVVNPMLCIMFGYEEQQLVKKTYEQLTHPDDLEEDTRNRERLFQGEIDYFQMEKRYICKDESVIWTLLNLTLVKDEMGAPLYYISQVQSITERKYYEEQLKESEQRLREIIDTVPSGVVILDLTGNITFANQMAEEIFGLDQEDITSRRFDTTAWKITTMDGDLIKSEDLPYSIVMKTRQPVNEYIHCITCGEGEKKILSMNGTPIFDKSRELSFVLFSIMDITKKKQTEHELLRVNKLLKKLSELDGLTGVANRRFFDEQLKLDWEFSINNQSPIAMIMFDLDFFKNYNDYYGHQAGDDCLKQITKAINEDLELIAITFARYGGEEFSLILPSYSMESAFTLAKQLQKKVEGLKIPHEKSDVSAFVTISLGVTSVYPKSDGTLTVEDLIKEADRALYLSKEKGRNCATKFSED